MAITKKNFIDNSIFKELEEKNLISDYFDFNIDKKIIASYGLNVFNIYTAYYLYKQGIKTFTLSPELSTEEVSSFIKDYYNKFKTYPDLEYIVYGKIENMIIKDNILSLNEDDYNYKLIDTKNRAFPTYYSKGKTHILNHTTTKASISPFLRKHCNLRFDFYLETPEEIKNTVKSYQ